MATFLFDKMVFGPVHSRRLGNSLGINLLPTDRKVCSFNCIYCECGWTKGTSDDAGFISVEDYKKVLQAEFERLKESKIPVDTLTFAGNGEPTMHPMFGQIIDITIENRDAFFPGVAIAVLSNATFIGDEKVFNALRKVELNILKLDSAIDQTIKVLNCPRVPFSLDSLVDSLLRFDGGFIMQTMFVKGEYNGHPIDNTTEVELHEWLKLVEKTRPKQVMVYTIRRDTPIPTLYPVGPETLEYIAGLLAGQGISASISI